MRVLTISGMAILAIAPYLCGVPASAQDTRISVAAVTKYTGASSPDEARHSQTFLDTLETQLAAGFVKARDIDYLDRSRRDGLFRESHLSSTSVFSQSPGALKGLLGRLDFLIVAEASTADRARLRVIDVGTGEVKVGAICDSPTTIAGQPSRATPECVPRILEQTLAAAKTQLAIKQNRLGARPEATRKRAGEEQAPRRKQADEKEVAWKQQEEIDRQLDPLRPRYESAVAQLSTEAARWAGVRKQLNARGLGLRADVESALGRTEQTADRCNGWLANRNPEKLSSCLDQLDNNLYQLAQYR